MDVQALGSLATLAGVVLLVGCIALVVRVINWAGHRSRATKASLDPRARRAHLGYRLLGPTLLLGVFLWMPVGAMGAGVVLGFQALFRIYRAQTNG